MPGHVRKPSPRAFTIVELVAVIGVIMLLLGLAVPAISMVREEARSTSCRSSLRQIGLGLAAYRTNIGDRIPSCEPIPAVIGEDEVEGGHEEGLDVEERLPAHIAKALQLHHVDVEVEEELDSAGEGEGAWQGELAGKVKARAGT